MVHAWAPIKVLCRRRALTADRLENWQRCRRFRGKRAAEMQRMADMDKIRSVESRGVFGVVSRFRARLVSGSVAHRLARGAGWSLLGSMLSQALALLSTIVVARYVGRVGYGEIGMVQSTLGVFGIVAGFGLGASTAKYVAEFRLSTPRRAAGIMTLTTMAAFAGATAMALACFAVAPILAVRTLNNEALIPLLRAGALLLFISTLNSIQAAALAGFEAFRPIAKINILQGLATPVVTIPCVWMFGVPGAIAALTIVACIGLILSTMAVKVEAEVHGMLRDLRRIGWTDWPILWKFALPSMLSALMVAPVMWITNTMLAAQRNGYGELGLFNVANQWRVLILYVSMALGPALMPVLSETYGRDDREDFRKAITLSLRVTWICALPLTVVVLGWAEPLAALFGRQFVDAGTMIPILAIACFLNVVTGTVGTALASSGRMWIGLAMNVGWATALIASAMMLIPHQGGQGLAFAYLIAYFLHAIWVLGYVDLKLAPASIVKQWRLFAFSTLILGTSFEASASHRGAFPYQLVLLLLGLGPMFWWATTGWRKAA